MIVAGFLAVALITGISQSSDIEQTPDPIPIEEWSLESVSAIGQAIHRQDTAAWVATDALLADMEHGNADGIIGWIVVPQGDDQLVRFVTMQSEEVIPVWDIRVQGRTVLSMDRSQGELSQSEQAQFRARQTAIDNIGRLRCSQNLNTVVLSDPDSDDWLVWLLTATTEAGVMPIGGHYRFRISSDGTRVHRRDMLSNSCFMADIPAGESTLGLFFTQIVSKGPVETHVFLSLQHQLPIYVIANNNLFAVDGADIRVVEEDISQ